MSDSSENNKTTARPSVNLQTRNRKRFLDISDAGEGESSARRQNPHLLSEFQETLRSMGVPSKKGFVGNESQYNDMIDRGLADNFEDSLSGLGVDISTVPYNMSNAMLALPAVSALSLSTPNDGIPIFKSEISPTQNDKDSSPSPTFDNTYAEESNTADCLFRLLATPPHTYSSDDPPSPTIHQLLQQHITCSNSRNDSESPTVELENNHEDYSLSSNYEDHRYQYILGAATSVAVKINDESLTYLNQGQPYEIKVKKLGDITRCQESYYHTRISVVFHERRLQFNEKEQMTNWKRTRPGERILEVDVPLSYGISDIVQNSKSLNSCRFHWEPAKEVGIYIKVNCISTEFTPRKHGGEKGVPFRLQIETFCQSDGTTERVHACACQIKVFKLKGADRKHKQDREKMLKRPSVEQEKFQDQCECTILQDISQNSIYVPNDCDEDSPDTPDTSLSKVKESITPKEIRKNQSPPSLHLLKLKEESISLDEDISKSFLSLPSNASASATHSWLMANRFDSHLDTFSQFTGRDLLRLSRDELIQICGLADGIRLFNCLQGKTVIPRLILYVCREEQQVYHAIYLENATKREFVDKASPVVNIEPEKVQNVYMLGPCDINILVNDEVIRNLRNESLLSVGVCPQSSSDGYELLIKLIEKYTNKECSSKTPKKKACDGFLRTLNGFDWNGGV